MSQVIKYFRQHVWQRRLVLALLVLVGALGAGVAMLPVYQHWEVNQLADELVEQLGEPAPADQQRAGGMLVALAKKYPFIVDRLQRQLATPEATRFYNLAGVLSRLGQFPTDHTDPRWLDRLRLIELRRVLHPTAAETDPQIVADLAAARRRAVVRLLLDGRDNRYVRDALGVAVRDPAASVRAAASALAARLGDNERLATLLDDVPGVAEAAAMNAGLAERTGLADTLRQCFARLREARQLDARRSAVNQPRSLAQRAYSRDLRDAVASAALGWARVEPAPASTAIAAALKVTDDPELRGRYLWLLGTMQTPASRLAVEDAIHAPRFRGELPPADAVHAATAQGLADLWLVARDILQQADDPETRSQITMGQVLASLEMIDRFAIPARTEVYQLLRTLWYPGRPMLLIRLARQLGRQIDLEPMDENAPTRADGLDLLRQATQYSLQGDGQIRLTPLGSAAAAVALWQLEPADSEFALSGEQVALDDPDAMARLAESRTSVYYLRETILAEPFGPGNYVAWHVARSGLDDAFAVGDTFLPARGGPHREYSAAVRTAGAMILALSAADDRRRRLAIERIEQRLESADPLEAASLRCALLMAGRADQLEEVRTLLEVESFDPNRALMALLVVGDKSTVDEILWDLRGDLSAEPGELAVLVNTTVIGDLWAGCLVGLGRPVVSASPATQRWQMLIARRTWGLYRNAMTIGLGR